MSQLKSKRAPSVDSNQRAWTQVYDDLNDVIKAVNQESGVESRNGAAGKDGDIRLFKDVDRNKFFIEGRFGDGWAKRELLFSDTNEAGQDESINFSATESYVKPDGSVPFTGRQTGVSPQNTNELATKGYVDGSVTLGGSLDYLTLSGQVITRNAIDLTTDITGTLPINKGGTNNTSFTSGKLLQFSSGTINSTNISTGTLLVDIIDTAATPGTGGQHGNLPTNHVCLVEDSGASGNQAKIYNIKSANNRLTISDSSDGGSDFIEFNVADQSLNINRFDTIYHYDDTDANVETSPASGADGIAFVDTSTVTFTVNDQAGSGTYVNKVKISAVAANDNTTYSTNASSTSGGANFNLVGANPSSTDSLKFASAGATTVTRTDASTIQISSTDTNTTNINSTESTGGSFYSLVEDSDTVRALKAGTGIAISIEGQGDGEDVVQISSTVNTSGLLTNGIVTVQDHDGGSVGNSANASGGDKLEFRDGGNITWTISGPTSDVIKVEGSVPNNTDRYVNAASFNTGDGVLTLTRAGSDSATVTVDLDGRYLTSHQNISGKANLAGGAAFTGGVSFDGNVSGFPDAVFGGTGRMVNSSAVIQAKGFIRVANHVLIHQDASSNVGNAVGISYINNNLSVYASSGTTAEGNGQANFHVPGDVIAYYSSDPRLKTNKKELESSLYKLSNINGYTFDWLPKATEYNSYNKGSDIGVMADEIEAMYPDLVETRANGYKAVKYEKLTAVLISAVNELTSKLIEKGVLDEEL